MNPPTPDRDGLYVIVTTTRRGEVTALAMIPGADSLMPSQVMHFPPVAFESKQRAVQALNDMSGAWQSTSKVQPLAPDGWFLLEAEAQQACAEFERARSELLERMRSLGDERKHERESPQQRNSALAKPNLTLVR